MMMMMLLLTLQGKRMHLATMWLGICGLAFMTMLTARRVKGAIMYGASRGWPCYSSPILRSNTKFRCVWLAVYTEQLQVPCTGVHPGTAGVALCHAACKP
jgi:hypothetical protein